MADKVHKSLREIEAENKQLREELADYKLLRDEYGSIVAALLRAIKEHPDSSKLDEGEGE